MRIAPVRVPRPMAVRAGAAAVPVVGPGLPCPVPSPVIAPRRGSRADRGVFGAFGPVRAAGLVEFAPTPGATPDTTPGGAFAAGRTAESADPTDPAVQGFRLGTWLEGPAASAGPSVDTPRQATDSSGRQAAAVGTTQRRQARQRARDNQWSSGSGRYRRRGA